MAFVRSIGMVEETDAAMPITVVKASASATGQGLTSTTATVSRPSDWWRFTKEWILKPAMGAAVRDAVTALKDALFRRRRPV